MTEAYIIDAVRTPHGLGKMGKGALPQMHPEHLSASVLTALKERNAFDTADVDDVIWGVSAGIGLQAGDIGRMAALDAGYDIKAGGVTLNRFCGSSITSTSFAAAVIMAEMHDLVVAGGMEMVSYVTSDDIDVCEVNEAFAVVVEKLGRDLGLDRAKVNPNGGSIALGHPIGGTGIVARSVVPAIIIERI